MNAPLVDIIIPTFNQPEMTGACAQSLLRHTPPGAARIIWVDNGSAAGARSDISVYMERTGFQVFQLLLPENLGFVKATNAGIAISTAPYVLLLNNDTEVPPGWLELLLAVMEAEPKVGIVGPLSSSREQWQGRATPGPGYGLLASNAMLAFFCALIRREVIIKCGYLSEEYRAGLGDDDDYCERVKLAGYRLALRTDLRVVHHHRTTFRAVHGEGGWLPYQQENIDFFKRKWGIVG